MKPLWFALALLFLVVRAPAFSGQARSSSTSKPVTQAELWKLDATYRDPTLGVTFQYPSAWKAMTEWAYHPPALKDSFAPPIAEFAYDGGFSNDRIIGPYSSTNLEGFGIEYSAIKSESAAKCQEMAASLAERPGHQSVVFGGRSYSVYETGEAGMNQWIYGSLYTTFAKHTCFLFETDVAEASESILDNVHGLTAAQLRFIEAHLREVMKSVRIMPSR